MTEKEQKVKISARIERLKQEQYQKSLNRNKRIREHFMQSCGALVD